MLVEAIEMRHVPVKLSGRGILRRSTDMEQLYRHLENRSTHTEKTRE
jgi:hypothetical protein